MAPTASLPALHHTLSEAFRSQFPERLSGPRTIGREAEFPVVDASGQAGDVTQLWPLLAGPRFQEKRDAVNQELIVGLEGPDFQYALEVGRGTIELNVGPCQTLFQLERHFQAGVRRLLQATQRLGWRLLGYGVQPVTPPGPELLSPKQRYLALAEIMGDEWLWYTVTASDQAHVDVRREELVDVLNFGHLMTPVIVALCANSPVVAGAVSGYCSSREGRMTHASHGTRHGMIGRPYRDLTDFVRRLAQLPMLLRREGAALTPDGRRFADVLQTEGPNLEAFLLHDHYVWHSARLRAAYGTLELRPACQQPPTETMAATALYTGLVEAHQEIASFVERRLGARYWTRMKAYHRQVISTGLAAQEPVPGLLAQVLALAESGLLRRGFGEERLLAPLWRRLDARENPAQQALRVYEAGGLPALLNARDMASI